MSTSFVKYRQGKMEQHAQEASADVGDDADVDESKRATVLYRPFTKQHLYYDRPVRQ